MATISIDTDLLEKYELKFQPQNISNSLFPTQILGFGEISTVFSIEHPKFDGLIFKRMPMFETMSQSLAHEKLCRQYIDILENKIGIKTPDFACASISRNDNTVVFYSIQKKLPSESIGSKVLHSLSDNECLILFEKVLTTIKKIWDFSSQSPNSLRIGIDAQISNWALKGFDPLRPKIDTHSQLIYIDTSTPFITINQKEQLNPDNLLKSCPSFLQFIVRTMFLEDVMTRYYDFRKVTIDIVANCYKENRPDLVHLFVAKANDFFVNEMRGFSLQPLDEKSIQSYYREDALIWTLFLSLRKVDRFLKTKIMKQPYEFLLPDKVDRNILQAFFK